jgi:hypothetical protein
MGCAGSLFSIIGKVAALIQKVRRSVRSDSALVSQAYELKEEMQLWESPSVTMLPDLQDSQSHATHLVQAAEALRYAALLYLHQAVPDIPSVSSEQLARKVLLKLGGIAPQSRATNMQIFPLFAASCEVTDKEDRIWVEQRWAAMISRLKVRNVDRCWEIVQDVWSRRNLAKTGPTAQEFQFSTFLVEDVPPEYTVRGHLHWLDAMKARQWEGMFILRCEMKR